MNAAIIALAVIITAVIAAGTCLAIFEETLSGGILLFFGMIGYLVLLGMVTADAKANRDT